MIFGEIHAVLFKEFAFALMSKIEVNLKFGLDTNNNMYLRDFHRFQFNLVRQGIQWQPSINSFNDCQLASGIKID